MVVPIYIITTSKRDFQLFYLKILVILLRREGEESLGQNIYVCM